jgi:hypothetical protein
MGPVFHPVLQSFWVPTKKGSTDITIPVTKEMAPNCYAGITLIQPHAQTKNDWASSRNTPMDVSSRLPRRHFRNSTWAGSWISPLQTNSGQKRTSLLPFNGSNPFSLPTEAFLTGPGLSYGSDIRDKAMIVEALCLMNMRAKATPLAKEISEKLAGVDWLSTQTTAYALIAIMKYTDNAGDPVVPKKQAKNLR